MISQISENYVESRSNTFVQDQSEEIHALKAKLKAVEQHNEILHANWREAVTRVNLLQKRAIELAEKVSFLLKEVKETRSHLNNLL